MSRDLVRIWSRRSRAGFAGVAAVLLALTACGGSSGSSGGTKTYTIAFISQGTSNSWAAQLDAVARKTAKADGIKLVYFNGQGDATKQLPEIDPAIARSLTRSCWCHSVGPRTPDRSSERWGKTS